MNTTVTIQKLGNSQGIRIPKYISDDYPLIDLEKKFAEYSGEIPKEEYDWGEPQGEEIL